MLEFCRHHRIKSHLPEAVASSIEEGRSRKGARTPASLSQPPIRGPGRSVIVRAGTGCRSTDSEVFAPRPTSRSHPPNTFLSRALLMLRTLTSVRARSPQRHRSPRVSIA